MKKIIFLINSFLIVLGSFFPVVVVHAELTIHITQGMDKPYPIALPAFAGDLIRSKELPKGFAYVIQNDLQMTGRFDFLSASQHPQAEVSPHNFQYERWASMARSLDFVVIGLVEPQGEGYHVSFQLMSLPDHQVLAGKKFNDVKKDQLRSLAHHISDLIYQVITGKKGDASSRIAYIEVTDQYDPKKAVYKLFVADADGFNPRLLLMQKGNPISSPKWSFDNQELAYVTYVNNRMAIYSIELKTGERRVLSNYPGINSAPAWSPDGRKMVMALSMGESEKTDLYIMDLATKKLDRLTQGETNTGPEWSPDGKRLAFTSNRGGSPQIYEMNLTTRVSKRITFEGAKNYDAEYTPDGRSLVMMHQIDKEGAIRIARFDIASQKFTEITNGQIDKSPSISPGGNMVLYASYDRRLGILAETSMNGAVKLELPSQGGSVQSPAWSK